MIVLEETEHFSGKYKKYNYAKARYTLVKNLPSEKLLKILKRDIIPLKDEHCLYSIFGQNQLDLELNMENIEMIESQLKCRINFYIMKKNKRSRRSLFHNVLKSGSQSTEFLEINMVIRKRQPLTDGSQIKGLGLIQKKISSKGTFYCNVCWQNFTRSDNLIRHNESDTACQIEPIITAKQKCFGIKRNVEEDLLAEGWIDPEHVGYLQRSYCAYDIETTEELCHSDTRQKAILKLLSISVMSTFDKEPTCFVREEDNDEASKHVVQQFITFVETKAVEFEAKTPIKFSESLIKIKEIESERRAEQKRCREEGVPYKLVLFPIEWKMWLKAVTTFKLFSFNGQRFDTKVLAPQLFSQKLDDQVGTDKTGKRHIDVLKRGSSYFSFSYPFGHSTIEFADICNYLSPCNLAGFLNMANVEESKSVFPYQHFKAITELENATTFPEYHTFWSDLKNDYSCTAVDYTKAKTLFEERLALSNDDPLKMYNMKCWLIYYNNLDTKPLLEAITVWFNGFMDTFGVDPQKFASLPSMSQRAMFRNYDDNSPYLYSVPFWMTHIRDDFRKSIVGGLCTNPHRMCDLRPDSDSPNAAKYAPNGQAFSSIIAYDFSSLYPWALKENMPCSPGILWELDDGGYSFKKKQMIAGVSIGELQYLMYLQYHDFRFKKPNQEYYHIEHSYFRGQRKIEGMNVDGFAVCGEKKYIIEYNGCWIHKPCPHTGCKHNEAYDHSQRDTYEWYAKEQKLRQWCLANNAELIIAWACQFDVRPLADCETPYLPRIMKRFEKKRNIIKMLTDDEIFGFIKCDIDAPNDVIERFKHLNFPPITRRGTVTEDMVSPYMTERLTECDRTVPVETVVNAWTGKQLMIYTPLLQLYLKLGLKISNVTQIIQYVPSKCFETFIDKCVQGRIDATGVSDTKANTYKV